MVARALGIPCLALMAQIACAAGLLVEADRTEIAFGQMVTVTIQADDIRDSIQKLPTEAIGRDFEVFNVSYSRGSQTRRGREIVQQRLEWQLFPLHLGVSVIPIIDAGGKRTRPLPIRVSESGFGVSKVMVRSGVEGDAVQHRESLLFVDVYHDGGPLFRMPKAEGAGFQLRPLRDSQRQETVAGERYTVTRFAWGITPLRPGSAGVRFSPLDASKFGARLRYPVPALYVNAAPVPGYLPVHVPVGSLNVESNAPMHAKVGRPEQWTLKISGRGLSPEGLRKQLGRFQDTPQLHFYPLQMELVSNAGEIPLGQTLVVTIPFRALEQGSLKLPEVHIPYYDPATGLVRVASTPSLAVDAVDPVMTWVWRGAGGGMVLVLALWAGLLARPRYHAWHARRLWLRQLASSKTPCELLRAWRAGKYETEDGETISMIERACYGPASEVDFERFRHQAMELAQQRKSCGKPQKMQDELRRILEPFDMGNFTVCQLARRWLSAFIFRFHDRRSS
ncbi:MAG: BatD family protein [Sulfuricella sp.]|nr:BatD family protein [Sulfuricella sp.]